MPNRRKPSSKSTTTRRHTAPARSPCKGTRPKTLESVIVELATSGELAQAAQAAIENHRRHGVPITYLRGDEIVTESPDGTIEVLERIDRPAYTLPAGVKILPRRS